jgi:hypothetical protein
MIPRSEKFIFFTVRAKNDFLYLSGYIKELFDSLKSVE